MRGYNPYSHTCQASLRSLFTNVPDKIYPNLVKEFYSNLHVVGKTLTLSVKNVRIMIHIERFGWIFEIPFIGTPYRSERLIDLKNFKRTVALNTFVTNPMEKRKLLFWTTLLMPKVRIIHYLITRIILPRNNNNNYVIKDDIILLWLLTQNIPTNWVDKVFHHISYSKEKSPINFPYEALVKRILSTFNIDT